MFVLTISATVLFSSFTSIENTKNATNNNPPDEFEILLNYLETNNNFINGIQLATVLNKIDAEHTSINYFNQDTKTNQPEIESISINEQGELSNWPKGFFDQTQIDFSELFKSRKNE